MNEIPAKRRAMLGWLGLGALSVCAFGAACSEDEASPSEENGGTAGSAGAESVDAGEAGRPAVSGSGGAGTGGDGTGGSSPAGAAGSDAEGGSTTGGTASGGNTASGGTIAVGGVAGSTCEAAAAMLSACDLVSEDVDCAGADEDPGAPCRYGCYALAACADIEDAFCNAAPNRFASCLARCLVFWCSDGTSILSSWQCDGLDDCPDGEDEVDCEEPAECSDGSGLSPAWVCDGFPDCPDGGDEVGCDFACRGGETIDQGAVCDGTADCADASDETACAAFLCRAPAPI